MKRGEVWTAAVGRDYIGKPRPVVIIQDDRFDATASVTICAMTTDPDRRTPVPARDRARHATTSFVKTSRLMVDKIATMPP